MFYNQNIPVHYIKIDTEGHEYYILKGGINTITKYRPTIQLEWNVTNMRQCDVTEEMMRTILQELNYKEVGFVEEEKLFVSK